MCLLSAAGAVDTFETFIYITQTVRWRNIENRESLRKVSSICVFPSGLRP